MGSAKASVLRSPLEGPSQFGEPKDGNQVYADGPRWKSQAIGKPVYSKGSGTLGRRVVNRTVLR